MPADVVPHRDLPFHVRGPYVVQCIWSPNGSSVRLYVGSLASTTIRQLHLEIRTYLDAPVVLIPGRTDEGGGVDITAIDPSTYLWMGVRAAEEASDLEPRFKLTLDAPTTGGWTVADLSPVWTP